MNPHKFESWFSTRLTIGAFPYMVNKAFNQNKYELVINVSDEYYGISPSEPYFWFPMNEWKRDMGLNSIYGAIIVLEHAEQRGWNVYLHCHMGSNRSWTVAAAYYYFRTGRHLDRPTSRGHINKMHQNCADGYLPPLREMEAWITCIREDLKDGRMKAGILGLAKVNALTNF